MNKPNLIFNGKVPYHLVNELNNLLIWMTG